MLQYEIIIFYTVLKSIKNYIIYYLAKYKSFDKSFDEQHNIPLELKIISCSRACYDFSIDQLNLYWKLFSTLRFIWN